MRRNYLMLTVVVLFFVAGPVCAQGLNSFTFRGVTVTPVVRAGYQQFSSTVNIPIPTDSSLSTELANRGPLDLGLKGASGWVVGIDLNARAGRFLALVSAEASAPKNIRLDAPGEPFWGGAFQMEWQGSQFQWSSFDARGAFEVRPAISIAVGFKTQAWSVKLKYPVDPTGTYEFFHSFYGDNYTADLNSQAWIPYLGVGFGGPNFKASLLFSPAALVDAKIPLGSFYIDIPLGYEERSLQVQTAGPVPRICP